MCSVGIGLLFLLLIMICGESLPVLIIWIFLLAIFVIAAIIFAFFIALIVIFTKMILKILENPSNSENNPKNEN